MTDLLCSVLSYQQITGDSVTATADVDRELRNAQQLLEEELSRPLLQAERTETCPLLPDPETGMLAAFPIVTPIIDAGGLTVRFDAVFGATPVSTPLTAADYNGIYPVVAQVTYTGGFDPDQTDPSARDYVPTPMRRDLAFVAYHLLRPALVTAAPTGATSVRVGDVGATFTKPQNPAEVGISWSRNTLQYRRRRI